MSILDDIKNKRANLLAGKLNVFSYPFPKLCKHIPGWERGHYIIVTANTKVGKTQLADYMYMLHPLAYMFNNRKKADIGVDVSIEYISLENSILTKEYTIYSHFVSKFIIKQAQDSNKKISIAALKSLTAAIDENIIQEIEHGGMKEFFEFIKPKYNIVDHLFTTIEIINYIHQLGLKYGYFDTNNVWKPHNPDLYVNIIIDHYGLLLSDNLNKNIFDSIGNLSKEIMKLKKVYYIFTFIPIQQQAAAAENIQSIQFRNAEPTRDNLGDNKSTGRDADLVLGLYSPYSNKLTSHEGMDVSVYKDNYRSMSILADRHYGKIGHFIRLFFDGSYNYFCDLE